MPRACAVSSHQGVHALGSHDRALPQQQARVSVHALAQVSNQLQDTTYIAQAPASSPGRGSTSTLSSGTPWLTATCLLVLSHAWGAAPSGTSSSDEPPGL